MLDDQLVYTVGQGEMPLQRTRREGADPVDDAVAGRPGGGEVEDLLGIGRRDGFLDVLLFVHGGAAGKDGHELVVVHQAGGQQAERRRVGADVVDEIEAGGRGDERECVRFGQAQGGGDGGHALATGRLQHGLPLLIVEAAGQRRGQFFLDRHVHGSGRRCIYCVSCLM